MKRFFTFLKTELKLSLRDMNMPIFAIVMPLALFIILGILYGTKPVYDGASYTFLEQSFGAVSAVAICASGLMGLPLAVAGLREMKILKRLRVTPVNPVFVLGVELSMYTSTVPFRLRRCRLRHFCGACGYMVRYLLSLGVGRLPCSRLCRSVCW